MTKFLVAYSKGFQTPAILFLPSAGFLKRELYICRRFLETGQIFWVKEEISLSRTILVGVERNLSKVDQYTVRFFNVCWCLGHERVFFLCPAFFYRVWPKFGSDGLLFSRLSGNWPSCDKPRRIPCADITPGFTAKFTRKLKIPEEFQTIKKRGKKKMLNVARPAFFVSSSPGTLLVLPMASPCLHYGLVL